jgi:hypothetical protein
MTGNKSGALPLTIFELIRGAATWLLPYGVAFRFLDREWTEVTSGLLDWIELFASEDGEAETLGERDPRQLIPQLHGASLKNDVQLFERLAFLNPRKERG